ncbi:MAG TPA: hypothetical protein DIU47_03755 [Candidatus Pacebacteria bacterium]|nr:MAG: hypothetical protein UX00_C0007G0019 [Microgenomates group bacterium GW2011_GWB1_45_17]KKU23533.1 MAG: hypothetical protein UX35_C0005G0035 [Microgenomates group bacterium GW2011_GWA1_46_15]KKU24418.1 MAG: hypothetical protein UX36_C0001G0035 [Microgenomates group bacterium GW2011_GWC1_46_15]HCR10849.1 hypothetical protein [Candidatus Paceibacterota bacterium]HCR93042.1 hypothetical protein [Candidatus Paceibacterota bacterium]
MTLFQATVDIGGELAKVSPNTQFDLGIFIGRFAGFGLILAGIATFAFLVLGGLKWTTAGGDKGKLDAARQDITNAIIGLTITAASFAFFGLLQYLFGIDIVKL